MNRVNHDEHRYLRDFAGEFLVACPHCKGRATVSCRGSERATRVLFQCAACNAWNEWDPDRPDPYQGARPSERAVDWYFHFPLWLQAPCCGHVLWALNTAHLSWLERFISAKIRERVRHPELGWANQSLASRLPTWMLKASHRENVLATIQQLLTKAE